jgi:hypothetical protein
MTTAIHEKRIPTRTKAPSPILDLVRKRKTLKDQNKSEAEIEREIGVDPSTEAQPPPRSRRKPHLNSPEKASPGPTIILLSEMTPRPLLWLWPGRVPLGKLTVLDGDPGLGKSLLSLDLAARVTTARPMPDGTRSSLPDPAGVVILSAEDDFFDTIHPRLEATGADLSLVANLSMVHTPQGKRLPVVTDLEDIRLALRRVDARLMIIDPLMAYLPSTVNSHRDQDIRGVLAPLAALVADLGVALLVLRHLNKMLMANALYRGGGSIGIIGAARSGLLVGLDPDDSERRRHVLVATKANLAKLPPALAYRIELPPDGAPFISWHGETSHTAAALLAQPGDKDTRSAVEEAVAFLVDVLTDGPVPANEVHQEAGQAGIARRTLHRAKSKLGIKAQKMGNSGHRNNPWVWALSQEEGTPHNAQKSH